jgi:glycosyltransferase involved in cell wall biosynthesis
MIGSQPDLAVNANVASKVVHCRMNGIWDLIAINRVKALIEGGKFDIVHTHLPRADVIGRAAARFSRVPVVLTTIHALDKHRERLSKKIHALADRITMRFATRVICVSNASRHHLCRQFPEIAHRVVTLHNGIDFNKFDQLIDSKEARGALGLTTDKPVIGVTARLRPVKGVEYLLLAVRKLTLQNLIGGCLIVGDGESKSSLERMAAELGISDKVVFTGYRQDVALPLAAMNIFVLPSISEGFPTCLMEAMAMRKPIIATSVGGVPEIIDDGETGVLVPPKEPDRLVSAIAKLIANPEEQKKMVETAYAKAVNRYSLQHMINEYESMYINMVRESSGRV